MLRRPRRWRMVTVGGLFALGSSFALVQRFFAQTHWDDDLPTWALIQIEKWCGNSTPIGVRKELRQRLPSMTPSEQASLAHFLMEQLRGDEVNSNAESAFFILDSNKSPELVRALTTALSSSDWQERQAAAWILRNHDEAPTSELLQVTLEALRYDRHLERYGIAHGNEISAIEYLREHGGVALPVLIAALDGDEVQQRQIVARMLCEMDTEPTVGLVDALIAGFTQADARYESAVCDFLFEEGIPRLVDYFGRHGEESSQRLREYLSHENQTTRCFAASILREITADPNDELIHSLVGSLRFDRWQRWEPMVRQFMFEDSVRWLVAHGDRGAEAFRQGMYDGDAQQRLLCAAIAGFAELQGLAGDAIPLLMDHLRDNRVGADAEFATRALAGFNEHARPWLVQAAHADDTQAGEVAVYLLDRLDRGRSSLDADVLQPKSPWSRTGEHLIDPATIDWRQLDIPRIDPARHARP